jgi:hypothetical protein
MALERVRCSLGWDELRKPIATGYHFYLDNFFEDDGRAKYFHNKTYPIDAHSLAQAMITLSSLSEYDRRSSDIADRVCNWSLQNMRSPEGWFYYQKWPAWTNRISYMRWTQSWMLLALASKLEASTPAMANSGSGASTTTCPS